MKRAVYDLTKYPTTYDFAAWAVMARTSGIEHVHFIIDGPIAHWKYPQDIAWKRFATILLPICKLARISYSVGAREDGAQFSYHGGHVCELYRKVGRIEKLKPTILPVESGYITITLRDSFRNKHRNSNKEAWAKFRDYLDEKGERVLVLGECEDAPLNVEHRMAYYCGAKMNMGVAQGPMALCVFSDAPYITLNQNPKDTSGEAQYDIDTLLRKTGFPPGSQYDFRTDRQALIWEPDTYENIVRAYEEMMSQEEKVAA
jgi:hypothetical protein